MNTTEWVKRWLGEVGAVDMCLVGQRLETDTCWKPCVLTIQPGGLSLRLPPSTS